jgi:hypothetical protein
MSTLTTWLRRLTAVAALHLVGVGIACATGEWWWALVPIPIFGQVPSSLTDDYGALLTTTLRAMQPRIHDNIGRGNRFLNYLNMRGRWRSQDGGERVKVGLMHALNSTADIYSGYGNLDTTPQDGITSAFYEWAQLATSIAISRKERRQNSGRSQIVSLLETKTTQAMASARELLNNCILGGRINASANLGQFLARVGRLDSGASGPLPLAAIIDANPSRSVAIGNINGNTHAFWRNQADSSTATTFAGYKQELNNLYNDCSKGQGGFPDLLVGDQVAWEQYFNALQNQERYFVTDKRVIDVLGGPNGQDDLIRFRGGTFIWDEVVPDVETNANPVDSIGTVSASTVFQINSQTMEYIVDSETDLITTPFIVPVGQDAQVAEILWMGAVACNNRRKNGVLYGIARNIVS